MYQLKRKIDTNNAQEFEKEIMEVKPTKIDAAKLQYISSAGLRVLMKLRKAVGDVAVVNVSSEVYEIFDVTGFTKILNIKKALREISIEGCEMIGAGGYGSVYRIDAETIVKVYHSASLDFIEKEREMSRNAFLLGIPTAISYDTVKVGDKYGVVYEMLDANTVAQLIDADPSNLEQLSASELKKLHAIEPDKKDFPDKKEIMKEWIKSISKYIEQEEAQTILDFIDSIPDSNAFHHGVLDDEAIKIRVDRLIRGQLIPAVKNAAKIDF